jgi:hypothetical protein
VCGGLIGSAKRSDGHVTFLSTLCRLMIGAGLSVAFEGECRPFVLSSRPPATHQSCRCRPAHRPTRRGLRLSPENVVARTGWLATKTAVQPTGAAAALPHLDCQRLPARPKLLYLLSVAPLHASKDPPRSARPNPPDPVVRSARRRRRRRRSPLRPSFDADHVCRLFRQVGEPRRRRCRKARRLVHLYVRHTAFDTGGLGEGSLEISNREDVLDSRVKRAGRAAPKRLRPQDSARPTWSPLALGTRRLVREELGET